MPWLLLEWLWSSNEMVTMTIFFFQIIKCCVLGIHHAFFLSWFSWCLRCFPNDRAEIACSFGPSIFYFLELGCLLFPEICAMSQKTQHSGILTKLPRHSWWGTSILYHTTGLSLWLENRGPAACPEAHQLIDVFFPLKIYIPLLPVPTDWNPILDICARGQGVPAAHSHEAPLVAERVHSLLYLLSLSSGS